MRQAPRFHEVMVPSASVRMMASFARSRSSVCSVGWSESGITSVCERKLLSCLRSWTGRDCARGRAGLCRTAGAKFLQPAGDKEIIERDERTCQHNEEKDEADHPQSTVGLA